jgi:hypothetical protein
MNTHSTVLDHVSAGTITSDRILQIALAAWREGNLVAAVDQFNDQFTFTDHALGLEFNGKISQWSDYYDQLKSQRYGVAALFTEWIEI